MWSSSRLWHCKGLIQALQTGNNFCKAGALAICRGPAIPDELAERLWRVLGDVWPQPLVRRHDRCLVSIILLEGHLRSSIAFVQSHSSSAGSPLLIGRGI